MLACLALTVLVSLPDPMHQRITHEWHTARFCEQGYLPDVPYMEGDRSPCEYAANSYIALMQHAGILPGSRDVISFRATCTNTI